MLRRFEVLLPLRFNDGTPVPDAVIADTLLEFEEQFGAVSCETQSARNPVPRNPKPDTSIDFGYTLTARALT